MKKTILALSTLVMSNIVIAGGGGSWSPSISPGHCVGVSYNPFSVFWNDLSQCREAIEKGYAKGVGFSGGVSYGTGSQSSETRFFSGVVKPGSKLSAAQVGIPETLDGDNKINGAGKITAFWAQ